MIKYRCKNFSLISKGIRFIKELRTIDPLPITLDEFKIFLSEFFGCKLYKKEMTPELLNIINRIDNYYHKSEFSIVLLKLSYGYYRSVYTNWSESIDRDILSRSGKFEEGIKVAWERINKIPKRYLSDCIGIGGNGICFNYPFGKIEKVKFSGEFSPREIQLYKRQMKNPLPIFIKVYTLEKTKLLWRN